MLGKFDQYGLRIGDVYPHRSDGPKGEITILDVTSDGSVVQIRHSTMSEGELCPFVTVDRLAEIADLKPATQNIFTEEDMLLSFVGGFLASAEGHNGECNDFTSDSFALPQQMLSIEAAKRQFLQDFQIFLAKERTNPCAPKR
ncbi:hypothetical protein ACOI1H_14825 [Loktanella sp. DJP18]|uniref:hypothetical protein n=1 Tax=Loktanella sp. DJP18 TaxID=3409788 RepID=UPI003BB5B8F8